MIDEAEAWIDYYLIIEIKSEWSIVIVLVEF